MNKIPVWIDTDCGVDDALALICACHLDNIEIKGVSSGVGTTTGDNTFRNTRNVLNMMGRQDIRVYRGADSAWIREYAPAPAYHGENGLGECVIEESAAAIETESAWDALYRCAREYAGKLKIVTVGQLTNLANTIVKHPDFVSYVDEVLIMGGAIVGGNTTIAAEANIYRDPQAAQCVFKAGLKIVLFSLDVTEQVYLDENDLQEISSYGNPLSDFISQAIRIAVETNRQETGKVIYCLHDPSPIIYLKYPQYFEGKKGSVYVETRNGPTCGKTVSDIFTLMDNRLPANDVLINLKAQREAIVNVVKQILKEH